MCRLERELEAIAAEVAPRELAVDFGYIGERSRASVNEDVVMHAASTMKLGVLLALAREESLGRQSPEATLRVVNRFRSAADGSSYALDPSDDGETDLYARVGEQMSVRELARRMITRSSNLATNILIEHLTPARVQEVVEEAGADDTRIVRGVQDLKAFEAGIVNVTTAHDLARILRALCEAQDHGASGATDEPWFLEGLAAQEFNEMIPAGLPPGTTVLHKTGQITRIHHDAAIVGLPKAGCLHFSAAATLVVMTRGFDDPAESAALGARVARTIHEFVLAH